MNIKKKNFCSKHLFSDGAKWKMVSCACKQASPSPFLTLSCSFLFFAARQSTYVSFVLIFFFFSTQEASLPFFFHVFASLLFFLSFNVFIHSSHSIPNNVWIIHGFLSAPINHFNAYTSYSESTYFRLCEKMKKISQRKRNEERKIINMGKIEWEEKRNEEKKKKNTNKT